MPTTTDSITIRIPEIAGARITPNPTDINTRVTLTVTVTETEIILEPYYYYAGEIYAGEV